MTWHSSGDYTIVIVFNFNICFKSIIKSQNNFSHLEGWLDDIGLPQYKSHFDEGLVDGRMLHYMTVVSDA